MTTESHRTAEELTARGAARWTLTIAAAALAAIALTASGCATSPSSTSTTAPAASQTTAPSSSAEASAPGASQNPAPSATTAPPADLKIKDTVVGKGATAKAGDSVMVDYTGWLVDGTKFDSSIGKKPFGFTIGQGRVIEGWDKGVVGMKVGGTRVLTIPPSLGYGAQGYPPVIPGDATLKFEIKLLSVQAAGQ